MTPCCTLRTSHANSLYIAFLIAILIHAAAFALWPEYVPKPYRLREVKITKWFDIPPDIRVPPPPPPVKPPDIPVAIEPSDDPGADETIDPTVFGLDDPLPPLPREPGGGQREFMHFEMPPRLVSGAVPEYPELARKAEVEGVVVVHVTVGEAGRVIDAWIASSQAEILNDSAVEAAYKYVFDPALQNDVPVKATICLSFRFSLTE
jgi:protein TonB